jgi:acyl carrier protein
MIPVEDITLGSSLAEIGLDSLVAVEFRNWLLREVKTDIRVLDIVACKTIEELVVLVVRHSALLAHLDETGRADDQ